MGHEEDRERKFEAALTRQLREEASRRARTGGRTAAGAGEQANEAAGDTAQVRDAMSECPDAEVLAAFHERMLSNGEMNAAKEHVAACSRCQEILAHLEAGDEIELQAVEEKVLEMREPVLAGAADRHEQFARATAPAGMASTTTRLKSPRDISSGRGVKALRWVAPVGAIAAGLLIWAVVRDKPHTFAPMENIQVAQERPEDERAAAPQTLEPEANLLSDRTNQLSRAANSKARPVEGFGARNLPAEEQSQPSDRLSKDSPSARGAGGETMAGRLATEEQGRADKYLRYAKPAAPPKSVAKTGEPVNAPRATASAPVDPMAAADARQSGDKQTRNLPAMARNEVILSPEADEAKKDPSRERGALSKEKLEPGVAGASPAPSSQPEPASESVAVQSAANATQEPAQKKDRDSKVNAEVVTTAQAEVSARYARTSSALKGKVADDSKIIVTPGGTVLWRLRAAGLIERSADSGLTWLRQNSGTTRELVTGSAPSDVVCWIVGRAGTLLRTTDGGGHWEKVVAPGAGEFTGIRATDALHATILDSAGQARFETTDGGVNWELVWE